MRGLGLGTAPLRVLCLGAHPDDIEIGCGGALLPLAHRDGHVGVRGGADGHDGTRPAEARARCTRFVPGARVDVLRPARRPAARPLGRGQGGTRGRRAARRRPTWCFAPRLRRRPPGPPAASARWRATVWRDALVLHYEIPKWDGDTRRSHATSWPSPRSTPGARSSCSTSTTRARRATTGGTTSSSSASCGCGAWSRGRRTPRASSRPRSLLDLAGERGAMTPADSPADRGHRSPGSSGPSPPSPPARAGARGRPHLRPRLGPVPRGHGARHRARSRGPGRGPRRQRLRGVRHGAALGHPRPRVRARGRGGVRGDRATGTSFSRPSRARAGGRGDASCDRCPAPTW